MKDIFWGDYSIDEKKAIDMIKNGDQHEKRFIFQKIVENSTNILRDLSYFSKDDLKKFLYAYKVSNFNKPFLEKRVEIVKNIFFDEPCHIEELEWRK